MTQSPKAAPSFRRFALDRSHDVSGISGLGIVAYGVQFPDGRCATRWRGDIAQTCIWDCVEHLMAIHGHGGHTQLLWLDGEDFPVIESTVTMTIEPVA